MKLFDLFELVAKLIHIQAMCIHVCRKRSLLNSSIPQLLVHEEEDPLQECTKRDVSLTVALQLVNWSVLHCIPRLCQSPMLQTSLCGKSVPSRIPKGQLNPKRPTESQKANGQRLLVCQSALSKPCLWHGKSLGPKLWRIGCPQPPGQPRLKDPRGW